MPKHVFRPRHDPPSAGDHFMVHSTGIILSIMSVALSVLLAVGVISNLTEAFVSADTVPLFVPILTSVTLGVGGVLAIRGMLWMREDDVSPGWLLEKVGWMLQATGYTAVALATFALYQFSSVGGWLSFASLAAVGAVRTYVITQIERDARMMQTALDKSRRGED